MTLEPENYEVEVRDRASGKHCLMRPNLLGLATKLLYGGHISRLPAQIETE